MASTFPNGGNANFDLEGTAAKISEVCKSLTNSQSDMTSCVSRMCAGIYRSFQLKVEALKLLRNQYYLSYRLFELKAYRYHVYTFQHFADV